MQKCWEPFSFTELYRVYYDVGITTQVRITYGILLICKRYGTNVYESFYRHDYRYGYYTAVRGVTIA